MDRKFVVFRVGKQCASLAIASSDTLNGAWDIVFRCANEDAVEARHQNYEIVGNGIVIPFSS